MRSCNRNRVTVYVLNFTGMVDNIGSSGYKNGQKRASYSSPICFKANVGGTTGNEYAGIFGINLEYDRVMYITKSQIQELKIKEDSVLFIDKKPVYDANDSPLYNYKIKRICPTLNEVLIAIKQVRNE